MWYKVRFWPEVTVDMLVYEFPVRVPISYRFTGKFESSSADWKHDNLPLDDYELFIITEGELYLQYQGHRYASKKGESLLLPPGLPPNNRRKGYRSSSCSFYWMHFSCPDEASSMDLDGSLRQKGSSLTRDRLMIPSSFTLPRMEKVVILMRQLQNAVRDGYHQLLLNYLATTVLCELHQQFESQMNQITRDDKKTQLYHDIVDYINRNISEKITVTSIAQKFGYNEKYLSHMFGQMSGVTLKQFILQNKMSKANFLLSDTNMQIAEISNLLGFSDCHNFMKSYKKITGMTPTEYRNSFSQRMLFHK